MALLNDYAFVGFIDAEIVEDVMVDDYELLFITLLLFFSFEVLERYPLCISMARISLFHFHRYLGF